MIVVPRNRLKIVLLWEWIFSILLATLFFYCLLFLLEPDCPAFLADGEAIFFGATGGSILGPIFVNIFYIVQIKKRKGAILPKLAQFDYCGILMGVTFSFLGAILSAVIITRLNFYREMYLTALVPIIVSASAMFGLRIRTLWNPILEENVE